MNLQTFQNIKLSITTENLTYTYKYIIQYFSYIIHDQGIFVLLHFLTFLRVNERKIFENRKRIKFLVYLIKRNPLRLIVTPLQPGNMFSQSALVNDGRLKAKSKKTFLTSPTRETILTNVSSKIVLEKKERFLLFSSRTEQ